LEDYAALEVTPSRHAMRREAADLLAQSLDQLPWNEQEVLRLRYIDGLTLMQISEHVGLTKDAVVWLMQKGFKRLRELLPDDDRGSQRWSDQ
jgi:RNA polymerase sigma factor (sigma-70 family)